MSRWAQEPSYTEEKEGKEGLFASAGTASGQSVQVSTDEEVCDNASGFLNRSGREDPAEEGRGVLSAARSGPH